MNQRTAPVKTTIRIIGDSAIVPSASGPHCYRVGIKLGVPVSCDCPARRKLTSAPCKHMLATRDALAETAHTGLDMAEVDLVPQTRKPKHTPKPAPTLRGLFCIKPAHAWTAEQRAALADHFADFEAAVW